MSVAKVWVSGLMTVVLGMGLAPAAVLAAPGPTCRALSMPVALGPGLPATETVAGTLCVPAQFTGPKQVDVLVHGASYNRTYWDFPVQEPMYSYVSRTLAQGRATFAYDRLGAGQSSRPLSTAVTIESDAYVLHQVIQAARGVAPVQKVNVVGHSFGSVVAIDEAATFHDEDRLVLTGLLHATGPGQTNPAAFQPAFLDPQFAGQGYDPGYLTSTPGFRGQLFYYAPTADPAVIAYDEAHKDVASATQFGEGLAQINTPAGANLSNQVTVPVLVIDGQFDQLFCGLTLDCNNPATVAANEAPFYTGSPSFTSAIVANTAHDLALHTTAGTSFATINQWIETH
ncbi:MAG TPA: alpha/beta hydrolase [Candidatus Saccharimonas sp.]|nr:alpha/beta hydrolase [Candidatus Saccharimonas sp.]